MPVVGTFETEVKRSQSMELKSWVARIDIERKK
jgi:hypothetical protein